MKLKLGIIGAGFVGGSVINGFDTDTVDQFVVDPHYNDNTIDDLVKFDPPLLFVCVPTPQVDDHYDVNVSIVRQVLSDLANYSYKGVVVIKSTITPKHLIQMKKDFDKLRLVYNPEFLTEANAHQDFINPDMQVLGGSWKYCDKVEKAYARHSKVKTVPTYKVDLITASLIKYTINSWLATKVIFMNELHKLHSVSGSNSSWDQFTEILKTDPRVGDTHMQVPGPDGEFGFGGHCFPKDTKALLHYAKKSKSGLGLLDLAVKMNQDVFRKDDTDT